MENKKSDKYINIKDLQNTSNFYEGWFVGITNTINGWKKQALVWCDMDGNKERYNFIKKHESNEQLINIINDIWSIQIVKYDKSNNLHKELKRKTER